MTKVYPVILTPTASGYVVTVPDLDINTQGKDLAEAIYMARDAIGLGYKRTGRWPKHSGTVGRGAGP